MAVLKVYYRMHMYKADLKDLEQRIVAFRDARDWKQFHNPKDMALSLVLEATELLEIFQWKREAEFGTVLKEKREEIEGELADVFYWVTIIANDLGIDILEASNRKLAILEQKYPVDKARGVAKKYTEF